MSIVSHEEPNSALDSARRKAYWRLIPLLFACYVVAYIDRVNVSLGKLTMLKDARLVGFNDAVIGYGAGIFFIGYFLLEIPGTLLVEKWSARKWICRIMVTWGIMAAFTAIVRTPTQFYSVRFLLGLAEAGFFPGAIVYMTHWFTARDRSRALSWFLIGTPVAQLVSPKISNIILRIGAQGGYPVLLGMQGWQWLYILWAIPALVLGVMVLFFLTDHPEQAKWLSDEEKRALRSALDEEKARTRPRHHMTVLESLYHPRVLLLSFAYFCIVTGNYGIDFFLPSILKQWYSLEMNSLTWLVLFPPFAALAAILLMGWSSDRTKERRFHSAVPGLIGGAALLMTPYTQGHLWLTIGCFMVAGAGLKAYLPPFWCLPSLFLTEAAAAGSIGLINAIGNLGGQAGPWIVGGVRQLTGSYFVGLYVMGGAMILYGVIILCMRLERPNDPEPHGFEPVIEAAGRQST